MVLFFGTSGSTMLSTEERKQKIEKLLLAETIDLRELKRQSRQPGGFIDSKLRTKVWPKLLGIDRFKIPDYRKYVALHPDDSQIRCDIERSLWSHKENKDWLEPLRDRRRKALSDIISAVLCRNRALHYYQGYHDVCSVFLLVVNDDHLAFALSEIVSDRYLRDFMAKGDISYYHPTYSGFPIIPIFPLILPSLSFQSRFSCIKQSHANHYDPHQSP